VTSRAGVDGFAPPTRARNEGQPHMQQSAEGNFNQVELDKFNELAHRWWDPQGPQKALHALNPARHRLAEQAAAA
jgi:2-polyprenyl-3-methyl-5-hydroxy-6-metoxy-1,4-benzoquinol methylase